ncbi:hypothetical protein [Arthrobacter sp. ISL-69]|uniref:hypothetical protein n=1 Tax=Arthrobacter sp. ISL-69 TaxID=2819113 RepID=UPI001BE92440|nr:hypothetical protein [Arthrobacter sp. ISL-69]MBT2537229.1 hypothetical protein [Arthrobacter sp. ISL-69]
MDTDWAKEFEQATALTRAVAIGLAGGYPDEGKYYVTEAKSALAAADAVMFSEASIWKAAEVAALVDDYDGCFERVREYEAMEEYEQEAHGYPGHDYEDRDYWLKRTRAVIAALRAPADDKEGQ